MSEGMMCVWGMMYMFIVISCYYMYGIIISIGSVPVFLIALEVASDVVIFVSIAACNLIFKLFKDSGV